jgi:glycine C-acetyltransferase/8-amino-7-oxononanoate synthase
MKFLEFLEQNLKEIKENSLYRERKPVENLIDFSSNDYLGLKNSKKTKEKLLENIENLPLGSGASTHISGYYKVQKNLENLLANFKETQASIVIGSGYMANVGLISALATKDDVIFSDELNHASIIDGIRLSKAKKVIYRHCDIKDLENKLKTTNTNGIKYIITDGIFSMEGDIAPIDKLYQLSKKYDAVLIIDDAHATGVIGEGKGSLFHF